MATTIDAIKTILNSLPTEKKKYILDNGFNGNEEVFNELAKLLPEDQTTSFIKYINTNDGDDEINKLIANYLEHLLSTKYEHTSLDELLVIFQAKKNENINKFEEQFEDIVNN